MESENIDDAYKPKFKDHVLEILQSLAIAGAIALIFRTFIAEPHNVEGYSMVPNFHHGDLIITSKITTHFNKLARGEVVIFKPPNSKDALIKRVIGLPGETIKIANNKVYINHQPLSEGYLPENIQTYPGSFLKEDMEFTVPENQYIVLGDNRPNSKDSRDLGVGPITKDNIVGQALIRIWPIDKVTIFNPNQPSL